MDFTDHDQFVLCRPSSTADLAAINAVIEQSIESWPTSARLKRLAMAPCSIERWISKILNSSYVIKRTLVWASPPGNPVFPLFLSRRQSLRALQTRKMPKRCSCTAFLFARKRKVVVSVVCC